MKRRERSKRLVTLTTLLLLTYSPSFGQLNGKSQSSINSENTERPTRTIKAQPSRGNGTDDIKLHGHWTIEIRNQDGTVSSHHEFENALMNAGSVSLAQMLAHQVTTAQWSIWLTFSGGNPNVRTLIENTGSAQSTPAILPTLSVSVPWSGANAGKLVLTGTVPGTSNLTYNGHPVNLNGQLLEVMTALSISCVSGVQCGTGQGVGFSDRDLTKAVPPDTTAPPAINVQPGQTLNVTVVFSFQ
jgi:hypothetical protein